MARHRNKYSSDNNTEMKVKKLAKTIRQCNNCYVINKRSAKTCSGCGAQFGKPVQLLAVQVCPRCTCAHRPAPKCIACGLDTPKVKQRRKSHTARKILNALN